MDNTVIIITATCPYFEIQGEEVPQTRCVRRLTEIRENFEARAKILRDRKARLTVTTHVKDLPINGALL